MPVVLVPPGNRGARLGAHHARPDVKGGWARTAPALSSLTVTLLNGVPPVLVTTYIQVTVDPTTTVGPGALSLSVSFVVLTIESPGQARESCVHRRVVSTGLEVVGARYTVHGVAVHIVAVRVVDISGLGA